MAAQEAIDLPADDQAAVEADEALPVQPDRLDGRAAGQRVRWSAGHDHLFLAPGQHGQFPLPPRVGHQAEVGRPGQHALVALIGVEEVELHLGVRVLRLEAANVVADVAEADRVDGRHAHGDGQPVAPPRLPDGRFQLQVLLQQLLAALVVKLAQGRQRQRPPRAVDELRSQPVLQLVDDTADRRLGAVIRLGRFREAAQADQITEDFESFQLHGVILA